MIYGLLSAQNADTNENKCGIVLVKRVFLTTLPPRNKKFICQRGSKIHALKHNSLLYNYVKTYQHNGKIPKYKKT